MQDNTSKENKEKVLHTRISKTLDEFIKSKSGELRIPVSNFVRNVLEEAADLQRQVSDIPPELARNFKREALELQKVLAEIPPELKKNFDKRAREIQQQTEQMQKKLLQSLHEEAEKLKRQVAGIRPKITRDLERDLKAKPEPPDGDGGTADEAARAALDRVYGWQRLVMNRAMTCVRCGGVIRPGETGHLGIGEPSDPKIFLCDSCFSS